VKCADCNARLSPSEIPGGRRCRLCRELGRRLTILHREDGLHAKRPRPDVIEGRIASYARRVSRGERLFEPTPPVTGGSAK